MNEANLKRQDLRLCRTKDLKEDWSREEVLSLLEADRKDFGKTEEVHYGKSGLPLGEVFWSKLRKNMNQESVKKTSRIVFALIVKQTDIRIFPTDELSMSAPTNFEFDLFQQSSISPGSPIAIFHFSKDRKWAYVQTQFIRGWIRTLDLAIAQKKTEVVDYEEAGDRLVVTGSLVPVYGEPSLRKPAFIARMGNSFPLLHAPDGNKTSQAFYVISLPLREESGRLQLGKGYLRVEEDVRQGFLPYHQENVARQAFKMLHHPYGWGDRHGGRDCSRFIMDIFNTFGILMPRNSTEQAAVGSNPGAAAGRPVEEKQKVLDQSIPLATTLRLPGHIMLYLGRDGGNYYAIHSIWGVQISGKAGPALQKIGGVAVSDLRLGEKGPSGSLLDRISGIRIIGPSPETQEK